MIDAPQLVLDDPWLSAFSTDIQRRMSKLDLERKSILSRHGSLSAYATGHHIVGIHQSPHSHEWTVREWLPNAQEVYLIGDFNHWNRKSHPLHKLSSGIWEIKLPTNSLAHGQKVKLHIVGADHSRRDRIPACIRRTVQDTTTFDFSGQIWQPSTPYLWQHPFSYTPSTAPHIYECHIGMSGEQPRVHTYREFADTILPRIAKAGYNVIQLMAVQEHPYYGSFGYHVSSFFAPSSRFGTPEDLKYLIDQAHSHHIAVLLDIVHSHAVKNMAEGLNEIDGSDDLYFYPGDRGNHPLWDSKCFNYSKPEVRQFLLSNVRYWLEEFHFDGFRFDGITSMLYESHGNKSFNSYSDYFGLDTNEDAILYLSLATELIREIYPNALIVAEDMSGLPGLCRPTAEGGLGFSHRLAMGLPDHWIKLLKHQRDEDWNLDELWHTLTNRRANEPTIAYSESHDQALVGDKTLAFWLMDQAMYWHMAKQDPHPVIDRGIALHKIIRLMTLALGGDGWLCFMGNDFGHPEWLDFPREGNGWSFHHCRRQWSLVDDPNLKYCQLAAFDQKLVAYSQSSKLLSAPKTSLIHIDHTAKILVAERNQHLFVFNLSTSESIFGYPIKAPQQATYQLILNSDDAEFGGHARIDASTQYPVDEEGILKIYTPARTALVFQVIPSDEITNFSVPVT